MCSTVLHQSWFCSGNDLQHWLFNLVNDHQFLHVYNLPNHHNRLCSDYVLYLQEILQAFCCGHATSIEVGVYVPINHWFMLLPLYHQCWYHMHLLSFILCSRIHWMVEVALLVPVDLLLLGFTDLGLCCVHNGCRFGRRLVLLEWY